MQRDHRSRQRPCGTGLGAQGHIDDVGVGHEHAAVVVARGHGQRVLDGTRRTGQHGKHLQVELVGPHPLQQGRVFDDVGTVAGELRIASGCRLRFEQFAVVPTAARANTQGGRSGPGWQIDLEARFVSHRAVVDEHAPNRAGGDAVVDRDVDGVAQFTQRLLQGRQEGVSAR